MVPADPMKRYKVIYTDKNGEEIEYDRNLTFEEAVVYTIADPSRYYIEPMED